jgi:hypothetical protein
MSEENEEIVGVVATNSLPFSSLDTWEVGGFSIGSGPTVSFDMNGKVTIGTGFTADEASKAFWEALPNFSMGMKDNKLLRKMLWIRHGCDYYALYGDDGEMQCCKCGIDFKRDPAETILAMFEKNNGF